MSGDGGGDGDRGRSDVMRRSLVMSLAVGTLLLRGRGRHWSCLEEVVVDCMTGCIAVFVVAEVLAGSDFEQGAEDSILAAVAAVEVDLDMAGIVVVVDLDLDLGRSSFVEDTLVV